MAKWTWNYNPEQGIGGIVDRMYEQVDDWTPVMSRIARMAATHVRDHVFQSNGDGKWKPLAQSTLTRDRWGGKTYSRANAARSGTLHLSGLLRNRITFDASKRNAAVINDAPHAHLMNYGTDRYTSPSGQRVTAYAGKDGRKRKSRGETKRIIETSTASTHTPARYFLYIDETMIDEVFAPWILDYFYSEGGEI